MNKHLDEVEMTYWQHFYSAMGIAWRLKKAMLAVFLHAFFPNLFQGYASNTCATIAKEKNKI